ncbi:hypothetical protein [Burkholderia ubonensis]|uniref:hypothetical protein n=1 Tax=Burkholderia ubonensis TaxID=101571 RepID=UPI0010542261|nr:hypothetical protein [Burkholderia ubonensis]
MNAFPEIDYQKQLIVSGLDDFSPNAALSQVLGGQFGSNSELWRQAVIEFLCINVRANLLECTNRKEISGDAGAILLRELLNFGDKKNNIDSEIIWNVLYFSATQNLECMLNKFQLNSWDSLNQGVNFNFIKALREIYCEV